MKTKVKLILFLALISSFSCSDTNSKLENELTKGDFYKLKFCHSDIYMYICIVKQE